MAVTAGKGPVSPPQQQQAAMLEHQSVVAKAWALICVPAKRGQTLRCGLGGVSNCPRVRCCH